MTIRQIGYCLVFLVGCSKVETGPVADPAPGSSPVLKVGAASAPSSSNKTNDERRAKSSEVEVEALKLAEQVSKTYPFPQDPDRIQAVRAKRLERAKAGTVDAFEKHGDRTAPWAMKAREALLAVAERNAAPTNFTYLHRVSCRQKLQAAIDAGCDDPLVRYFANADDKEPKSDPGKVVETTAKILADLERKGYPSARLMNGYWNLLVACRDGNGKPVTDAQTLELAETRFWYFCEKVAKENTESSDLVLFDLLPKIINFYPKPQGKLSFLLTSMTKCLETAKASDWLRGVIRGYLLVKYAWEARGRGVADTVSDENFDIFRQRLRQAEAELETAWKSQPLRSGAATAMITVCMGLGHDREVMELWFQRAMQADPDDAGAVLGKAEYLLPKWHGSDAEIWDFYVQAYATKNYESSIAFLCWWHVNKKRMESPQNDPMSRTDRKVRDLTLDVFRLHLEKYPADRLARSTLFAIAAIYQERDVAQEQINVLENKFEAIAFGKRNVDEFRQLHLANGGKIPEGKPSSK